MNKSTIKTMLVCLTFSLILSSCYSYTSVVGVGAYGNKSKTKWNHYFLYGSIRASISDSKDMAEGSKNYTVHTRQTVINWLITTYTIGLYTPTTTTVTVNPEMFENQKKEKASQDKKR